MVSVLRHNARSSDKHLEEAQSSGILSLPNRKMRDVYYLSSEKYDLDDVTEVDLSNNGLQEVPTELGEWYCIVKLNLSSNTIRMIPDSFASLCLLHTLDMSSNLLVNVPPFLSDLKNLMILRLQNNKIVGLPSEISKLTNCQELDVSGNQIRHVPEEIGNMGNMFHLDLSRNQIEVLPDSISKLPLIHFDVSSNKISMVPLSYQNITSLKRFNVTENPLRMPSLHVLKYGRVHFFKALEAELSELHQKAQVPLEPSLTRKISKEDSFDTVIERYSSMSSAHDETLKPFPDLENVFTDDQPPATSVVEPASCETPDKIPDIIPTSTPKKQSKLTREASSSSISSQKQTTGESSPKLTKSTVKSSNLSRIKAKQPLSSLAEKQQKPSSPKRSGLQKQGTKAGGIPVAPPPLQLRAPKVINVRKGTKGSIPLRTTVERKKSLSSPKRTVKEAKENQSSSASSSPAKKSVVPKPKVQSTSQTKLPQSKIASPSHTSQSYPGYAPPQTAGGGKPGSADQARFLNVIKPRKAHINTTINRNRQRSGSSEDNGGFTMRRKAEKMYEELELIENIRGKIEGALKVRLANDLQAALADGVVLCQLANFVKPRSIPTIHVPSPAVPKLSSAKCRRNVENFLEVCPRLGVKPKELCTSSDIMCERGLSRVVDTVNSLLKNSSPAKSAGNTGASQAPSVKVVSSFLHSNKKA